MAAAISDFPATSTSPGDGAATVQNDFGVGAIGAFIGVAATALISGVFNLLGKRQEGETDQSVAVLAEWSKLNKGLADRLGAVEKEFSDYRQQVARDMDKMRDDCRRENEEMRAKHRAEMRAMRELNEGLQRMIAQNSQSTANLLSDSPVTRPKDDGDDG
jgi:formiminotetrahydrofolate cyclodeaminase